MPDLAAALRAGLPPGMALGHCTDVTPPAPWPGETPGPAIAARQREFAAGRAAARQAIRALGQPESAVPMGPDRAPVWPAAVTGSISHCAGACMAVAGLHRDFAGIGLDVEPLHPIEAALWPSLLTPAETAALADVPQQARGVAVLHHFVAKEAAYKAQYALSRQLIDFHSLQITANGQGFAAEFQHDVAPFAKGAVLTGVFTASARHLAALVWVAQPFG